MVLFAVRKLAVTFVSAGRKSWLAVRPFIHVQELKHLGFLYQAESIVYKHTDQGIKTLSIDMFRNCFALFCQQLSINKQELAND